MQKKFESREICSKSIVPIKPEKAVIIFSKAPTPGCVKTRLTQNSCLLPADAAAIAEGMLKDTIALASESITDEIVIGYAPVEGRVMMERITREVQVERRLRSSISFAAQVGSSFDERFGSILSQVITGGSKYFVIVGADLPYLPPSVLNQAFIELARNSRKNPLVIGPAGEGGIYLVGVTRDFDPESFKNHKLFSGGVEISQFVKFSQISKKLLILLPPFNDIDVEEDLVSLLLYIEGLSVAKKVEGFHFPRYTASVINQLGLTVINTLGETRHRRIGKK